ncbi:MAG: hypothetical protein KH441_13430 [Clostridium sp.]|nr:hypothetical protein [Clostridium sp.]
MTEREKNGFSEVAESLKKYRRADLVDQNGESILDELYVDLLDGNIILQKCLLNNTTFLVGRKGTGKSTLILSILVDTFSSRISLTMPPSPKPHNTACVLS